MARVLILSEDPPAMPGQKAGDWLRVRAARLRGLDSVSHAEVHRLSAFADGVSWSNWLVELQGKTSEEIASETAVVELVGDLRVLGMRPYVLVVREDDR